MPPPGQTQRAESKFIVFEQFEKMNTQSVREALSEKELAWLENLQPIAPNNLTTVPGPLASLTSISETITFQYFANLGSVDYIISFTSVGSAWSTNIATGASTRFAAPGTFTNPDMTVWQSQYALFNDPTAGYSAWNGTVFVRSGGVSPLLNLTAAGSNYTSIPTVAITGGSGSGATATATIGTPGVIRVDVVTNGSGYSSPPTVVFSGGGGTGAAATAHVTPQSVNSITITNPGLLGGGGGIHPVIAVFSGGGGSGAAASVSLFQLPNGTFEVIGITITNGGTGYSSAPTLTLVPDPAWIILSQPTATCTVGNGGVATVTVTSNGSGYTSAPAVAFSGGGGSGASAVSGVGGSGVTSLTLTNPGGGFLASDTLTLTISGGGGTGATGTAHVWPFVPAGTTLAVFGGRVWLGGNRLLQYTGTGGFDDFAAANASASLTIGDSDLTHAITALRSFNNYLYIMGDQSVKQIGAISLNAAGNVTLFTILTLSSDQGTIYTNSCASFNRLFMFANTNGIYAVFGSSVQKISDDLDGIFRLIDFTVEPQAALADINNIHHIIFLVRYRDPVAGPRSIMLAFNGKKWFVISQGNNVVSVVNVSTLASGLVQTFASSGSDITQILENPNAAVPFKLVTSLTHHGNAVQNKKILAGGLAVTLANGPGVLHVTYDTENGSETKDYPLVTGFQLPGGRAGAEGSGRYLGVTITGTLSGATFTSAALEEQENALWKSGSGD